jgi:NitT/TauT family transport system ATP-binding protein
MSQRPGRILMRKEIRLPRPRDLELTYTEPFAELVHGLREKIGHVRQH